MSETESRLITSRSGFHDAVRQGFAAAARLGCRELWLCDADFADWPLGERSVIEQLTRWATSQRRLTLLATQFDDMARRHPRWVAWRRDWAHVVHCRANTELERSQFPCVMLAPGAFSVALSSPVQHRGRVSDVPADLLRWKESIDAVLQRSEESFPATTTGL